MDERTEARILGLASTALTLFGVFAPYRWHDMPPWITDSALALALFFGLWALFLALPVRSKGKTKLLAADRRGRYGSRGRLSSFLVISRTGCWPASQFGKCSKSGSFSRMRECPIAA